MTSAYRPYGTHYSILEYVFKSLLYLQTNFRPLVLRSYLIISSFEILFQPSQMKTLIQIPECGESLSKLLHEASLLTDELFDLQEV